MKATRSILLIPLWVLWQAGTPVAAVAFATPVQVADLGSFFHGDPPPVPKAPPPKQLAAVTSNPGQTPDAQVESFMKSFALALKARDGKPLLARLSERYRIDDLPGDKKPGDLFLQAIDRLPGPTAIIIHSVDTQEGIRTARIEFQFGTDPARRKTFKFDAAGNLLWSDLFKLQIQRQGA